MLLFLMVLNGQPFPNQATTFSQSGNDFPIKTVVLTVAEVYQLQQYKHT